MKKAAPRARRASTASRIISERSCVSLRIPRRMGRSVPEGWRGGERASGRDPLDLNGSRLPRRDLEAGHASLDGAHQVGLRDQAKELAGGVGYDESRDAQSAHFAQGFECGG